MPIYEYKCSSCGHKFELFQRFSDPAQIACPRCDGSAHRLISLSGFVLKGSGWYVTDYPSASRKSGMAHEKKSHASTSVSAAATKTESSSKKTDKSASTE